jgi:DNA-binding CsgD family transcriptional regulator
LAEGTAVLDDAFRHTGIGTLGPIPWGAHLCLFHETKQDLFDTMVPYFRAGLENKEFCLWILPQSITRQEALDALRQGVPDIERHVSEASLELVLHDQWFFPTGKFELAAVIERFREKLGAAVSRGYVGLRANGSSAWLRKSDAAKFCEFEKELDDLIAGEKMIVVCSFPLGKIGADEVLDAARTHQLTAALRHGSWEVIETHAPRSSEVPERASEASNAATPPSEKLDRLTPRERAVFAQVVAGASSKEAAQRLGISPRTIDFHRANILQKLGAKNTADLIRIVLAE